MNRSPVPEGYRRCAGCDHVDAADNLDPCKADCGNHLHPECAVGGTCDADDCKEIAARAAELEADLERTKDSWLRGFPV